MVSMGEIGAPNQDASTSSPDVPESSQAGQVPPSIVSVTTPGGGGGSKKIIWIILVISLLLLLGVLAYFLGFQKAPRLPFFQTSKSTENSISIETSTTPTPLRVVVEGTEDWPIYKKESQFSFSYPSETEIKEYDDGSIAVTRWGPTQKEGTEFYDGLSISFRAFDSEGKTLKETADEKYLELKEVFETSQPVVGSLGGVSGYTFHVKGYVEANYYYIAVNPSLYLEVINATKDPSGAGFSELAEKILMTLSLNP